MIPLPVTAALAAFYALMTVLLAMLVSLRRFRTQAVFGDAGDETLRRRIRAHGNFSEYAPLALMLVALLEYCRAGELFVPWLAGALALSRVLHALGMLYTTTPVLRGPAMVIQHAAFVLAALRLAGQAMEAL